MLIDSFKRGRVAAMVKSLIASFEIPYDNAFGLVRTHRGSKGEKFDCLNDLNLSEWFRFRVIRFGLLGSSLRVGAQIV